MIDLSSVVQSLPTTPMELTFDLPFKNHPPEGTLKVYTSPLRKGVLILSAQEIPTISTEILTQNELFLENFEKSLVSHLFYLPETIKQEQQCLHTLDMLNHQPCHQFHLTYKENDVSKVVHGMAIVRDHILYHLFYIAPEASIDHTITKPYDAAAVALLKAN